jgi:hypothetical protein
MRVHPGVGTARVSDVSLPAAKDKWIFVVVAKAGADVILRLNEGVIKRGLGLERG